MNQAPFEDRLRAGFAAAEETDTLSARIDKALFTDNHKRVQRRRFKLLLAGTAVLSLALVAFPTVQAQAQLRRIAGALDNVDSVVIQHFEVSRDGRERAWGKTLYDHGKWRIDDGPGVTLFRDGTRWIFDPAARAYIMERNQDGPAAHNLSSLSLSSIIAQMGQWNPGQRVDIESHATLNGRDAIRATVENSNFGGAPERFVMFADPATNLPIECRSESSEGGGWELRNIIRFDYATQINPALFELDKRYPVYEKKEWEAAVTKQLTAGELFSTPIGVHRLVIRSFDVADDGTVFVSYQAGEKTPNWDRGYVFDVSDNLGTRYTQAEISSRMDEATIANSGDGKVELEVFVPMEPAKTWQPRTVKLTAHFTPLHHLTRAGKATALGNGGDEYSFWFRDPDRKAGPLTALTREITRPTCMSYPDYAGIVDMQSFSTETSANLAKAKARAWSCLHLNDYSGAERWLVEELRLMRQVAAEGGIMWSQTGAEKSLEHVRKMISK